LAQRAEKAKRYTNISSHASIVRLKW